MDRLLHNSQLVLWVISATEGLCREAQERIRTEIEGHYADAFQNGLDGGCAQVQAPGQCTLSLLAVMRRRL